MATAVVGCDTQDESTTVPPADALGRAGSSVQILESSTDTPIAIPDNKATGIVSTISVAQSGEVASVEVTVDISHPWRGDIRLRLQCPDGTMTTLKEPGFDSGDDIRATYTVAACNGREAAGLWKLIVSDHGRFDVGTLNNWSLAASLQSWSEVLSSSDTPISIPDNNPVGVTSVIESRNPGSVTDAQVQVDISHTYRGDVQIELECPSGARVTLKKTANDSADNIRETYAVTACSGHPAAGQWKLIVSDRARRDTGRLNDWTLRLKVLGGNEPPVAVTSDDMSVSSGDAFEVLGDRSYDPEGQPITYTWKQTFGPAIEYSNDPAYLIEAVAPEVEEKTVLSFELIVNDGQLDSEAVSVNITVMPRTTDWSHVAPSLDTPLDIPDAESAGIESTIVPGIAGTLSNLQAQIDIIHPNVGNLTMDVICPNGTVVRVHDRQLEGTAGLSASYSLRACDGLVARSQDQWTLRVVDHVSGDAGLIRGWHLSMDVHGEENRAPVARVTHPQISIHVTPSGLNLDANARSYDPDGDSYTCLWTQISGPNVEIYNPTNCQTAADIRHFAQDTDLQLQLVINDGRLDSLPAIMDVHVDHANSKTLVFDWTDGLAIPDNNTSGITLDARFYETGDIVGARLISDIDHDNLGALQLKVFNPFTNSWVLLHDRTNAGTADLKQTFDVTALYTGVAYPNVTYQINVNDNDAAVDHGYLNSLRLELDVLGASWPPQVRAGRDRDIPEGTTITLDGMGTTDEDWGDVHVGLAYAWTQVAGPSVQLEGANTPYPTFTAPQVDETTVFEFQLVVSDSYCSGDPDTVQIAVYDTPATCGNRLCDAGEGAYNCADCRKDLLLVVESALLPSIQGSLDTYLNDLEDEGLFGEVTTFDTGTVDNLRDLLAEALSTRDISGAMLIGNLPTAWFEDLHSMAPESEFPGDVYFMDLDADYWVDADNNGRIETSDEASEAFHADIFTSRLSGTPDRINAYFARLHQYRMYGALTETSAYLFFDDDFAHAADGGTNKFGLDRLYNNVEVMYETDLTTKAEYLDRLTGQGAEFVYQTIHSSPQALSIIGTGGGTIRFDEIAGYNFKASFLMMNDCSALRYTEDNLGMAYTMNTGYGLNAIGSSRVWYGIYDTEFQDSLVQGVGWGEAYRRWVNYPQNMSVYNLGTVVTGDPANVVHGNAPMRTLRASQSVVPALSQEDLAQILRRNVEFARTLKHESFEAYRARNPQFFSVTE